MTGHNLTATLRILTPSPGVYAYYDGRIEGRRLHSQAENWLDDGAYKLGIASYAIVDGDEALVYDTHMTLDHAQAVRRHLRSVGVGHIRVMLSHWHDDHVAGNAVFADCEIIAHRLTLAALSEHRLKLEAGDPPIRPLVLPSHIYEDRIDLKIGSRLVSARHFDIHSADGTVLLLEDAALLFAGDTVEDTATYVSEPEHTARHVKELKRLAALPFNRLLPCHGDPDIIAGGGYEPTLIGANRRYLERLLGGEGRDGESLATFVADDIKAGFITYFAPYEDVHRANLKAMESAGRV
ncbi:MBL fold metallo-hydrolase [Oryzibacter oryziterrae]|uniref:MBL fold metallo-hydrolase n=1 Tax=Oryzibacter oryziterrae TaxID=2766474 RepID=UPI001F3AA7B9|nr:MBL fold metallo-hydrolase [Oryzibacter oryziterrae]